MNDTFHELARHYDAIMDHINYDRWVFASSLVAELAPQDEFNHLDIACGTGIMLKKLRQHGMNSVGIDLSHAMIQQATAEPMPAPAGVATMTQQPFADNSFSFLTCVFDSLNFLVESRDLRNAFLEMNRVLKPDGVIYFDVITEAMVTEHFADQEWEEKSGKLRTTWEGTYDSTSRLSTLTVRIGAGLVNHVVERVYSSQEIQDALTNAGLVLLGEFDAENWKTPTCKTLRIDHVAIKRDAESPDAAMEMLLLRMRGMLKQ
jgi:ubiquinone/menaquinone biosynthesis C-methylase UbiE